MSNECAHCSQPAGKMCSRCRETHYCSAEHQREHWPLHKKMCKKVSQQSTTAPLAASAPAPPKNDPIVALQARMLDPWKNLSKKEAYMLLIDAYRLRVEDEYSMTGEARGLYGGGDSEMAWDDFVEYVELAMKVAKNPASKNALPSWWKPSVDIPGIGTLARKDDWACIFYAVESSDIKEHYKDRSTIYILRAIAERIYGGPVSRW